ncbi:hypothetical protein F4553_004244 [Allocatelliglobosispora scoriae]|uniref:DUF5666 domain-containing protein n=1 Tax=Allocatelliglobosispora scoriae TaxID=643052 RepID=A0A841BT38_9ACTN|nr:hypothetical protein [Allocatelliglobosispora scoriae]MBB5870865.1 hypothetical protein [Allocatelliglobosispora scoriae]
MSEFDDLAVGLARAERKPWLTRSTLILGALVIALAGFVGGVQVQKSQTPAAAAAGTGTRGTGRQFPGGYAGGFNPQAQGGTQTAAAASATTGKIKLVDGTTIYIETATGDVITVKTTGTTTVQSASTVKLSDLKPGTTVTVQGPAAGSDGIVTATSVTAAK